MLASLSIRDILIIDRLELKFQPGLNVLTGETGAGKSILLDALGFVLGWRGQADLVRQGAEQGEVTAVFELPPDHAAFAILDEAGLEATDGELILRRQNGRDGRKSAFVNDRPCSGAVLRRLSEGLVELHGQHDDRGLLNPKGHRALLDAFAANARQRKQVRAAWADLTAAREVLSIAQQAIEVARAEEDFLRHAASELDDFAPQPGEETELDQRRRWMQGAERIRDDVQKALKVLTGDGAEGRISDAMRWLEGASAETEGALDGSIEALSRAMSELGDATSGVERCLDALEFDPFELESVEERLFALRALARKHNVLPADLPALAASLRARLDALNAGAVRIAELEQAVTSSEFAYYEAAQKLSRNREKAAKNLDKAMGAELVPLKMERAVFSTEITKAAPSPQGQDAVAFTVATNPGAPSGPLNKIASGGELSRFLLALKVCLTAGEDGQTLIFDEIDRGVGGATADAVGRRLRSLSTDAQVLVVTHSPQVAALGAHHWRVEKSVTDDATISTVVALDASARVDEIARMLSGDRINDAAREAARALLAPE
jgi:DNA repair protein RecN (Recombination protein N)